MTSTNHIMSILLIIESFPATSDIPEPSRETTTIYLILNTEGFIQGYGSARVSFFNLLFPHINKPAEQLPVITTGVTKFDMMFLEWLMKIELKLNTEAHTTQINSFSRLFRGVVKKYPSFRSLRKLYSGGSSGVEMPGKKTLQRHPTNTKHEEDSQNLSVLNTNQSDSCKVVGEFPRRPPGEPWTVFCCESSSSPHIDSVFNMAVQVQNLKVTMYRLKQLGCFILQDITNISDEYGEVNYAIVKSCCGNVVHTLIEKTGYDGWFLPEYERVDVAAKPTLIDDYDLSSNSFFDHVTLVCRTGGTNDIIRWYQDAFEMKRFITNRQDSEEEGIVIGDDVGMRLKVMEFWKCSEVGIASTDCQDGSGIEEDASWEPLKIVIAESLPDIQNTQVEQFIADHNGPGLQHIGLHTSDIVTTVNGLSKRGIRFREPPPTYYTDLGQRGAIELAGEDPAILSKYGILLDVEADPFDEDDSLYPSPESNTQKYLMQIFTHPIFNRDTFFLEVIQRKGARGFGVGNVTALARSVNAYQQLLQNQEYLLGNK
ncbi:unnamed protein product [Allacma fusca]|uniref:VOC domain-containing protein n=1 Tax=Allacma fusca TaxID=39272 RepID=A0A8J2PCM3_9HEXA|nr:unnamed protein product [Allacma fusca]